MSYRLLFDNLVAYSLQIGMLVGVAAVVPTLLRLRQPGAKLLYWQILLALCLLLPLQPWHQTILTGTVRTLAPVVSAPPVNYRPAPQTLPRSEIALWLLLAGTVIRLGWLGIGVWKLRRYRRNAAHLEPAPSWSVEATLLVSEDVTSPVTFGWLDPVVMLPANFPHLDSSTQDAILCHEVMHVRRRDWVYTIVEEVVRAIFWFHPAIWWLLGEIGLAREQEVDRLAIEITHEREQYVDALMAIAGARSLLDLAPAPLFLRKRHLKHRVVSILQEGRMSKQRLISTLSAGLASLAAACWLVTGVFPLTAQPQVVFDGPGISVNLNGATLLHRGGVMIPGDAVVNKVQGTVSVELKLAADGTVSDAHVIAGPDELRRYVLSSVLQWHFTHDLGGTTHVVEVAFTPTDGVEGGVTTVRPVPGVVGGVIGGVPGGTAGGVIGGIIGSVPTARPQPIDQERLEAMRKQTMELMQHGRIGSIRANLPEPARSELLSKLPVHEGDELDNQKLEEVQSAVRTYDEHLRANRAVTMSQTGEASLALVISAPGNQGFLTAPPPPPPLPMPALGNGSMPSRIKVGGNVQSQMILQKVAPEYPPLAKSARVSGVVHLDAVIGKDGTIKELHVLGGPALLQQSAMDAVKLWVYRPTLLNGEPVDVETTIDVNFTLNE